MPGINVSALSGGDLRRLLKVAHARHDGLLADRLEWEIAARATSGGHSAPPFATLPDDEPDEPAERRSAVAVDSGPPLAGQAAPARRGAVLVTLGAIAGSLLSASVFWGLERLQSPPARLAELEPALAITAQPPTPTPMVDQTAAVFTPEPVAVVARSPPARVQRHAAAKTGTASSKLVVAATERPSRPPTLNEWLKAEPEEPIF